MSVIHLLALTVSLGQLVEPHQFGETIELDPQITLNDSIAPLIAVSDLVFSVKSVTRRISILGWSSERYDLEIGEVLLGCTEED